MPKIIINNEEKNCDTSSFGNLNKLYENLLGEFATKESFVTSIKLNGEELSENELQKKGDLPVNDIETFEMIILTLPEMTLNSINNVMEYLAKLIPAVKNASELFRTKSPEEANKYYLQCVEGLTWFQEVVDNISSLLKLELEKLDFGSKSFEELQKQLLSITKEIHDSQDKKDWVMLADLLEYELTPYLEEWQSVLPLFVRAVQKKASQA
mgnify:CR=1 FL=1|tara:strand:- start:11318 stop:11950 length:633 start_codon:yes stop_codon:yes gene_type:complete